MRIKINKVKGPRAGGAENGTDPYKKKLIW